MSCWCLLPSSPPGNYSQQSGSPLCLLRRLWSVSPDHHPAYPGFFLHSRPPLPLAVCGWRHLSFVNTSSVCRMLNSSSFLSASRTIPLSSLLKLLHMGIPQPLSTATSPFHTHFLAQKFSICCFQNHFILSKLLRNLESFYVSYSCPYSYFRN